MANLKFITFNGITLSPSEWAKKIGIKISTFYRRLKIDKTRAFEKHWQRGRKPKYLTHNGKTLTEAQWAKHLGIGLLYFRKKLKLAPEEAFDKCRRGRPSVYIEHDGKNLTYAEWAKRLGISKAALYHRLKYAQDRAFVQGCLPRGSRPGSHRAPKKLLTHDGLTLSKTEWAKKLGITISALYRREKRCPERLFCKRDDGFMIEEFKKKFDFYSKWSSKYEIILDGHLAVFYDNNIILLRYSNRIIEIFCPNVTVDKARLLYKKYILYYCALNSVEKYEKEFGAHRCSEKEMTEVTNDVCRTNS